MKISDLYGGATIGAPTSQDDTNPVAPSSAAKKDANAAATGKPLSNSYGVMAILAMVGILIGAKFALEKR